MNPLRRRLLSLFCGFLSIVLFVSLFSLPSFAATDTQDNSTTSSSGAETVDTPRIHAAYSFTDMETLLVDLGEDYPLSTETFGTAALSAASGYKDGGMKGYVALNPAFFQKSEQFSLGFWAKFSRAEAESKTTLFLINGKGGERVELAFSSEGKDLYLRLTVDDGPRMAICSFDLKDVLGEQAAWTHYAFTYKKSGTVSLLTLYVNGKPTTASVSTSFVDLSRLTPSNVGILGVTLDELYVTNYALEQSKITALVNLPTATFFASEEKEISGGSQEGPVVPEVSTAAYEYSWAAYLFEGTFAAGTDFHSGDIPASVDNSCVRIDSSRLSSKFGYAIIRRDSTAPAYYLKLDSRLINGQSSFSFACWVYRSGSSRPNDECLLDLNGIGTLRFAPYAAEDNGTPAAYLEYSDSRGNVQHKTIQNGSPADPRGSWVHYALTVSQSGDITVYVNGDFVETFASGVNPASLALSDGRVITGASSSDGTRTAIDEVYVSPKVLSAADVRKIHVYGVDRFTSEVLPDPGQTSTGEEDSSNPYAPDATDIAEDSYTKTAQIANGFVGTTFDDRGNVGRDWNVSADASVTGGMLTNGVSSYGLSMDGVSSFLRYPMGIFDGADSFTIALSYSWSGATSATERSQRIFDFSRKASSVADPTAYIYLETGLGFSGLRFGISDGIHSTYLTCDYNAVDTWTRVTVTVSDGVITLYLNDTVAATASTDVDVASVCPNFCYIGKSGVKGDPLFKGIVDEIYLSRQALSPEQVGTFTEGIAKALQGERAEGTDLWSILLWVIVAVAVLLVLGIVAVIIVVICKKDKKLPEVEPPVPVPLSGEGPLESSIGPRSARRAMRETSGVEVSDATVQFKKVSAEDSDESANVVADQTVKFRKVDSSESDTDR